MAISYLQASGKDVAELVAEIEEVVQGKNNVTVSIACLIIAALAQNPEVDPAKLQVIIQGMSEYMAASLFDTSPAGAAN